MRRERQTIIPSKQSVLLTNTRPHMSRAELHAITEIDLQRFDYRERVQRLKQRVIAAKTNSLPVMSIAEFFCYFMPDIPQGGMSGFLHFKGGTIWIMKMN